MVTTRTYNLTAQVGENIRNCRNSVGMTLEQLANTADISVSHMGGIERGTQNTTLQMVERIAEALDVEPMELLKRNATRSQGGGLPAQYNDFYDHLPAVHQRLMRNLLDAYIKSMRGMDQHK